MDIIKMKYLKKYNEDIEWEFEDDETDFNKKYKIGDYIKMDNAYTYKPPSPSVTTPGFYRYKGTDINTLHKIIDIKKSEEVVNKEYGEGVSDFYDGYLYRIKGKWPWYKID